MTKTYKISYKTYLNDRLKEVTFYGEPTYPLYIQVSFERKTIFFKSYFFELFSQNQYTRRLDGKKSVPSLDDIIKKEEVLIKFIIDKNIASFSLDVFKQQYSFYSTDLCTLTAVDFRVFIVSFFINKNMNFVGASLAEGSRNVVLYEMIEQMKSALQPALFQEFIIAAFEYGTFGIPYLLLYGFMKQIKKAPLLFLSVMDWQNPKIRMKFAEYIADQYPDKKPEQLIALIDERIAIFEKEGN